MNKNEIVCAIDVNDFDQQVVDLAATFAKQFNVKLNLLHVTLFPDPTNAAWPAYIGAPNELIRDNRLLREIHTEVEGVEIVRHHLSGFPVEKILGFVERNPPEMLVLGTHAHQGIKRFLGGIASKILRLANCPVMVLRMGQNSQKLSRTQTA